jgi:hypothetical protein
LASGRAFLAKNRGFRPWRAYPARNGIHPGRNGMGPPPNGIHPAPNGRAGPAKGRHPARNGRVTLPNGIDPGGNGRTGPADGIDPAANGRATPGGGIPSGALGMACGAGRLATETQRRRDGSRSLSANGSTSPLRLCASVANSYSGFFLSSITSSQCLRRRYSAMPAWCVST